jgi:hypothetical protein
MGMRLRGRVSETVDPLEGTVGVVEAVVDVVEEGLNVQAKPPQKRRSQSSRSACGPTIHGAPHLGWSPPPGGARS